MADKKTFTIQINGIEQAYKDVIKLRDAVKSLENKKINIDDKRVLEAYQSVLKLREALNAIQGMEISIGSIELQQAYERVISLSSALEYLNYADLSFGERFATVFSEIRQNIEELLILNVALGESFSTMSSNSDSQTSSLISNNEKTTTSIASLRDELSKLKGEYEKLSEVERNDESGKAKLKQIGDLKIALATAGKAQDDYTKKVKQAIALSMEEAGSITQLGMQVDILTEQYNNLSEADRMSEEGAAKLEMLSNYQIALAEATQAIQDQTTEVKNLIALNAEEAGSITQKEILLKQLETQYKKLNEKERESAKGRELSKKIRELKKDIFDLNKEMLTEIETLGKFESAMNTVQIGINTANGTVSELKDLVGGAAEVLKTFGIESEAVDTVMKGLNETAKVLNTAQQIYNTIMTANSVATKAMSAAQTVYAVVTGISTVATTAFATALAATGIMAIVGLLALLIMNFDKVTGAIMNVISALGGFTGIIDHLKVEFKRVKDMVIEYVMLPFRQVKNGVLGAIKAFKAFKEAGGFFAGLKAAAKSLKETAEEAVNIVTDSADRMIEINKNANEAHVKLYVKDKENYIKEQEEKQGGDWKFSEEGKKAYKNMYDAKLKLYKEDSKEYEEILKQKSQFEQSIIVNDLDAYIKAQAEKGGEDWKFSEEGQKANQQRFDALLEMYKDDVENFKKAQEEKALYDQQLKEFIDKNAGSSGSSGSSGCKCGGKKDSKGSKGSTAKNDAKEKAKQEAEELQKELENIEQIRKDYQQRTIESEIEYHRDLAKENSNAKMTEADKLRLELLKKNLNEKIEAQKKASDEEIKAIKNFKEAKEASAKAEEELLKTKLEVQKQIAEAELAIMENVKNKRDSAVTEIEEAHKKETALLVEKHTKENEETEAHYQSLLTKYANQTEKIEELKKAHQERMDAMDAAQKKETKELLENQAKETEDIDAKAAKAEYDVMMKKIDMEDQFVAAKEKATEMIGKDMIARNKFGLIDIKATKKNYQEAIQIDKEYQDQLKKNQDEKIKILDEQIDAAKGNAELEAFYLNKKIDAQKDFESVSKEISSRMADNMEEEKKVIQTTIKDAEEKLKEKWEKINAIMSKVGEALTSRLQDQLDDIKKQQEEVAKQYEATVAKRKECQDKLNSLEEEGKTATGGRAIAVQEQIAREMQANEELAKQEQELAKKKEKLEKDAAKKEKQMKRIKLVSDIAQSIANTAMSVARALATVPFPLDVPHANLMAKLGTAQTIIIASQLAKLEDGGLLKGKRHAQGGMRVEGTNIEVEGDEYVVNRVSTSKNLGLIDYINKNRKELTASDINSYFARSGQGTDISYTAQIAGRRMYEQGGQLTNLEAVDSMNAPDSNKILDAIDNINFKPVVSVVDITSAQNNLSEVQDIAGI